MILCAICKRPICNEDLYVDADGRHVHIDHPGVRENYVKSRDDIKLGFQLMLKNPPLARPKRDKSADLLLQAISDKAEERGPLGPPDISEPIRTIKNKLLDQLTPREREVLEMRKATKEGK